MKLNRDFIQKFSTQAHVLSVLHGGHVPFQSEIEEQKYAYQMRMFLPSVSPSALSIDIFDRYLVVYYRLKGLLGADSTPCVLQVMRIPRNVNRAKVNAWEQDECMRVSLPKYTSKSTYHRQIAHGEE